MFRIIISNKKLLAGLIMLSILVILAVFSDFIAPYGYDESNVGPKLLSPSLDNLLGTDHLGRDLLSRVIYGSRISLFVAIAVAAGSGFLGIIFGALAGYYSNRFIDNIIMRIVDILFSIPWILIGLMLAVVLNPGVDTVIYAMIIVYTPQMARVVRSVALEIKEQDLITAAKIFGENDFSIIFRYVVPNCFGPVIIQIMFIMSYSLLGEAALSFLGYGVRPPTPSWGLLLQSSIKYMWTSPYLFIFPGLVIIFVVLSFNFLGDGLRDFLDPKYRRIFAR